MAQYGPRTWPAGIFTAELETLYSFNHCSRVLCSVPICP